MIKNKNVTFVCLLVLLAASEFGLVNVLSDLIHQYGDMWKNLIAASGYGGVGIAIIDKMLEILKP
jgi:hypothetical protein